MTPHEKQVMMFSATLSKEIRPVCKKFMQDVIILRQSVYSLINKLVVDWDVRCIFFLNFVVISRLVCFLCLYSSVLVSTFS